MLRMFSNNNCLTWTCPTIMSLFLAQLTLVCPWRGRVCFTRNNLRTGPTIMAELETYFTLAMFYHSPLSMAYPYFPTCSSVVALFPTHPALMLFYHSLIAMAYPYLSTCSSVVAFFPAHPTRESPINQAILEFRTVVFPMPFTSTVLAVEFYSCI